MKTLKKLLAAVLALTLVLTMTPSMAFQAQAASKSVTVSTQSGLKAALKNTKVTSITIKTSKTRTFTIGSGSYTKKTLTISAPKATISNSGKFKSISIKDATKFTEKAKNNVLKVTDSKLSMVVSSTASVKSLTFSKKSGTLTLTNNGKISAVSVTAKSALTMKGSASKNTKVSIGKNAAGTKLTSSIGLTLTVGSNATINLLRGAGTTKITLSSKDITAKVSNKTLATITIKRADGTTETVKAGKSSSVTGTKPSDTSDTDNTDEGNKDDTNTDDTNKDDTNTDDTNTDDADKDDSNKDDNNSGGGSGGGGFIGGGGGGSSSNSTARTFASAIASAQDGSEVTLSYDVTGDVTATWNGSGTLTIKFGTHKINGSLSITAPNAAYIYLNDAGEGSEGATISGNLTINAPTAHVENYVKVNGTIKIDAVNDTNTFVLYDTASKLEVWGHGKIQFPYGMNEVPPISIKTESPVILDGDIQDVTVEKAGANISITDGTTIDKVEVSSSAASTSNPVSITGNGTISALSAAAPVEVGTDVSQITLTNNNAEITVNSGTNVGNVVVSSTVTSISLQGEGTISTLDVTQVADTSNLKIDIAGTESAPIIVAANEEQAKEIADNNNNITVLTITKVYFDYDGRPDVWPVNEGIDLVGAEIVVTFSDSSTKNIPITADMCNDYILSTPGTSDLIITYCGVESNHFTITYLAQDILTLTCSSGVHSTIMAPEGFLVDTYTVDGTVFKDLKSYLKATSSEGLEDITFYYKDYYTAGNAFETGLPAKAGNYTIEARTTGTDTCFGDSTIIFLFASDDYLEINESKVSEYAEKGINWDLYSYDGGYREAYLEFTTEASVPFSSLETIIKDIVFSHNNFDLATNYFSPGCHDGENYSYQGYPTKEGDWVIDIWSTGSYTTYAGCMCIFVCSANTKFRTISAEYTIIPATGSAITGSAISADGDCNQEIHFSADDEVSIFFYTDSEFIDKVYIYRILTVQDGSVTDSEWIADVDLVNGTLDSNSIPNETGYYWFWVRAAGNNDAQETWVCFNIYIE